MSVLSRGRLFGSQYWSRKAVLYGVLAAFTGVVSWAIPKYLDVSDIAARLSVEPVGVSIFIGAFTVLFFVKAIHMVFDLHE